MKKLNSQSLFFKTFVPITLLGILLCGFLLGFASYYDVLGQIENNASDIFNQKVTNRAGYLESEMNSLWSNIEPDVRSIESKINQYIQRENVSVSTLQKSSNDSHTLTESLSSDMISILRNHGTTGVFMTFMDGSLEKDKTNFYPGLYIRDNDPNSEYEDDNDDLLLVRAPVSLVKSLNIPTDSSWKPSFEFQNDEYDLVNKLYDTYHTYENSNTLSRMDTGYWISDFKVHGSDSSAIAYVLPIVYDHKVIGMIGVDISYQHLSKLLHYDELDDGIKSAYIVALQKEEYSYESVLINGPYYNRHENELSSFTLSGENNQYFNNDSYTYAHMIPLYNSNTPYESETWVLMGIIDQSQLFAFSHELQSGMILGLLMLLALCLLFSYAVSIHLSRPIIDLAKRISSYHNIMSPISIEKTKIVEIDQLIDSVEKMSRDVIGSSSRFNHIIQLAKTQLSGFEIDYKNNEIFITDNFFDIFLLNHVDTRNLTVEEFNTLFHTFDNNCIEIQDHDEYLYYVSNHDEHVYLRFKYYQSDEKCVGIVEEVTNIVEERQEIEYERDHDVLTNLINRRAFQRQMRRLFSIETPSLKTAALLMIDLDNLKTINDKYGHRSGDEYIIEVARLFKDNTPEGTIVSRTSGDEFYIFYYGYKNQEDILKEIDILKDAIDNAYVHLSTQVDVKVHVSGGIAWYPKDSNNFEELQRFSDYAMYAVKNTTKGMIKPFNLYDYESNTTLLQQKTYFNQIMDENLLEYHFQPIIDIKTGEVYGYEALMRSTHPKLNKPAEILTIAKLEAKLNKIEEKTWLLALERVNELYQNNLWPKNTKVFVNSISNQIVDNEFIELIENKYPDILSLVVLEMTEEEENLSTFYKHKEEVIRSWNAHIALDDYGSGYNNERNLLFVNPDFVKVDMDIMRDIDKDLDKQEIVENIVSYCHERGKYVIGEGVETLGELRVAIMLKVDMIQGFYFAKPAPTLQTLTPTQKNDLVELAQELKDFKKE